jgi:hypothetical protein
VCVVCVCVVCVMWCVFVGQYDVYWVLCCVCMCMCVVCVADCVRESVRMIKEF